MDPWDPQLERQGPGHIPVMGVGNCLSYPGLSMGLPSCTLTPSSLCPTHLQPHCAGEARGPGGARVTLQGKWTKQ